MGGWGTVMRRGKSGWVGTVMRRGMSGWVGDNDEGWEEWVGGDSDEERLEDWVGGGQ